MYTELDLNNKAPTTGLAMKAILRKQKKVIWSNSYKTTQDIRVGMNN